MPYSERHPFEPHASFDGGALEHVFNFPMALKKEKKEVEARPRARHPAFNPDELIEERDGDREQQKKGDPGAFLAEG